MIWYFISLSGTPNQSGYFYTVILFSVLLLSYYVWTHFTREARHFNKFSGPAIFPFVGNLQHFGQFDELPKNLMRFFKRYGKTYRIWFGHIPALFTCDVAVIQKVLSSHKHVEKGTGYRETHFLMGEGLVTAKAPKWRKDRRELKPAFKNQHLTNFISCFNKNAKILLGILEKKYQNGKEMFDIRPEIGRCTIDIICETALDVVLNAQLKTEMKFYETVSEAIELITIKMFQPWVKLPIIWDILGYDKIVSRLFKLINDIFGSREEVEIQKKEHLKLKESGELDEDFKKLVHLLAETGRTYEDMMHHATSVFGAGFDTTTSVMNFTLYCLAVNPEVQKKVHEELDDILGTDLDQDISLEDAKDLKYLDLVLKESMRLYPPAPLISRKLVEEEPLENGLVLPIGCDIIIVPWEVHRDPDVYPNPEEFIPERFLPENSKGRSAYAYIPFSAGPRNCLGQYYAMVEMKVLLGTILRRFNVHTNQKPEELILHCGVVLVAKGGLQLNLTLRQ